MITAKCPNNPNHDEFITSAHVAQDWKVDKHGNFEDCVNNCTDITSAPCKDNIWTCAICGAEAIVKEE